MRTFWICQLELEHVGDERVDALLAVRVQLGDGAKLPDRVPRELLAGEGVASTLPVTAARQVGVEDGALLLPYGCSSCELGVRLLQPHGRDGVLNVESGRMNLRLDVELCRQEVPDRQLVAAREARALRLLARAAGGGGGGVNGDG